MLLASARRRTLGISSPALAKSGALYVGARFGQVQMRPALGARWSSLDTGTVHEILAVLPLDDGRLLAGGEEGTLVLSADQGRSWKRLAVASPGSNVVFLGAAPDGALCLVAETENELRVYSTAQPTGLWREVGRIPSPDEGMGLWTGPLMRTDVVRWGRNKPRDFAALTNTRLVVYTTPHELWSYEWSETR